MAVWQEIDQTRDHPMVTSLVSEGPFTSTTRNISSPATAPLLTFFHTQRNTYLSLLFSSYLRAISLFVTRHSPHPHGDSSLDRLLVQSFPRILERVNRLCLLLPLYPHSYLTLQRALVDYGSVVSP